MFDKEGNGYIGQGEFRYILTTLGEPLSDHEVDELLKDAEITPCVSAPFPPFSLVESRAFLCCESIRTRMEKREKEKKAAV